MSTDAYQTCLENIQNISLDNSPDTSLLSQYETPLNTPAKTHDRRDARPLAHCQLDLSLEATEECAPPTTGQHPFYSHNSPDRQTPKDVDSLNESSNSVVENQSNSILSTSKYDTEHILLLNENLRQINAEFSKIDNLHKQIQQISDQFRLINENLVFLNRDSVNLIGKLLQEDQIMSNILCDAQTQTDITNSNHSTLNIEDDESDITLAGIDESLNDNCDSKTEIPALVKHKLRKLPALIKGHLVRRLMQTETIQQLKRTIRDTSKVLINFKSNLVRDGKLTVTHEDILFHQRLCIQLENACKQFYAIFFNTSKTKQMSMIAKHRGYVRNQMYLKEQRANSAQSQSSSSSGNSVRLQAKGVTSHGN